MLLRRGGITAGQGDVFQPRADARLTCDERNCCVCVLFHCAQYLSQERFEYAGLGQPAFQYALPAFKTQLRDDIGVIPCPA